MTDFLVENHGTIFLLTPMTPRAHEWVADHLPDDAPRLGASVAVEHRYIRDIVTGAVDDGLTVE